jgi:hypothetical protein
VVFELDGEKRGWGEKAGWQARIDFPSHGFINLWRDSNASRHGTSAVLFIDCVSRAFNQKLNSLELVGKE